MNNNILKFALGGLMACGVATTAQAQVDKADKDFKEGHYSLAIKSYKSALMDPKGKHSSAKIHFKIGEAYRLSNKIDSAATHYKNALDGNINNDRLSYYYGVALKQNGKYAEAKTQFERYIQTGTDQKLIDLAKIEIENLTQLKDIQAAAKKKEDLFVVENYAAINTTHAEFSPFMMGDMLAFSSSRAVKNDTYHATGQGYLDLFIYNPNAKDEESKIQHLNENIRSKDFHEACGTLSPDGKILVFAISNVGGKHKDTKSSNVNLYASVKEGKGWSEPKMLPFSDIHAWDSSPMFAPDGTLYFSSGRANGFGGHDLYKVKLEGGKWSQPENLGEEINTARNEQFPFIDENGNLYFSSDGHPGYGGLDIFGYFKDKKSGKEEVVNLGAPLNSAKDDFGFILVEERKGYFSSNRPGGKGDDDIYSFIEKEPIRIVEYYLEGIVDNDGQKMAGVKVYLQDDKGNQITMAETNKDGYFKFNTKLSPEKNYKLEAKPKTGLINLSKFKQKKFKNASATFSSVGKTVDPSTLDKELTVITWNKNIAIGHEIIELEEPFIPNPIYYGYDEHHITDSAKVELNRLVDYMKRHTHYKVEFGSHTDTRGSSKYNHKLAQKRADAAVAYIVSQGIEQDRIVAKGYGEDEPVYKKAKTKEEHAANRRTTVKILDKHWHEDVKEEDKK